MCRFLYLVPIAPSGGEWGHSSSQILEAVQHVLEVCVKICFDNLLFSFSCSKNQLKTYTKKKWNFKNRNLLDYLISTTDDLKKVK